VTKLLIFTGLYNVDMNLHVHLLEKPDPPDLELLKSLLGPSTRITSGQPRKNEGDYHILVAGRPERSHLELSANLKAVVIPWAGVPEKTRQLLSEYPAIEVHNLHHNAIPTAELAVALLFSAAKFILPFDRSLRDNDWRPRYGSTPSVLLQGKTVLILGYGNIGQHVGKICLAAGMKVLAIRRHPLHSDEPHPGISQFPPDALDDLLPRANALVITLPLTPTTRGLIGESQLEKLPAGTLLVNVARGAIVDEKALYRSLQDGRLAGAGLDVWYNYPDNLVDRQDTPPANYPFHRLDNVVMSPHRGGSTRETDRLRMEHLAVLLNDAARGRTMPNKVDLQAGY
jgi:phosphoglycerate dehydrogenase-like enzyme